MYEQELKEAQELRNQIHFKLLVSGYTSAQYLLEKETDTDKIFNLLEVVRGIENYLGQRLDDRLAEIEKGADELEAQDNQIN